MELALLLYAASIAENIKGTLHPFVWLFGILAVVSAGVAIYNAAQMEHKDPMTVAEQKSTFIPADGQSEKLNSFHNYRRASRLGRKACIWFVFAWFVTFGAHALMPQKSDVYVIAGGYVALKAANSDFVQSTSNKALAAIEGWLDKELERNKRIDEAKNQKKKEGK